MSETVLNFGCPSCHNAVRSTTDKTGSTIECQSCKCFITVPSDYFSSTLVWSDSHIYYRCPSCLTKYQSAFEKSGSPLNCPSCRHYFLIPSLVQSDSYIYYQCLACSKVYGTPSVNAGQKNTCTVCSYVITVPTSSTFAPNEQQQSSLKAKALSNSGEQQSKLIDCPDCGASISRLATACPKCGRPITDDPHLIAISWSLSAILGILAFFMTLLILNEIFRWVIISSLNNR